MFSEKYLPVHWIDFEKYRKVQGRYTLTTDDTPKITTVKNFVCPSTLLFPYMYVFVIFK